MTNTATPATATTTTTAAMKTPMDTTDTQGKRKASTAGLNVNTRPVKRRASKACCCCRARKVRCDVVENGSPCTNCRLDQVECVVTESKRRKCVFDSLSVLFDTADGKLMDGAGNPAWRLKTPLTTSQNRPRRLLKTTGISSGDSVRVVASRMWLLLRLRSIRWIWTRGNICRT